MGTIKLLSLDGGENLGNCCPRLLASSKFPRSSPLTRDNNLTVPAKPWNNCILNTFCVFLYDTGDTHVGCFKDIVGNRTFNDGPQWDHYLTPKRCIQRCLQRDAPFAGLEVLSRVEYINQSLNYPVDIGIIKLLFQNRNIHLIHMYSISHHRKWCKGKATKSYIRRPTKNGQSNF